MKLGFVFRELPLLRFLLLGWLTVSATSEAEEPRVNAITLDLIPVITGELSLGYERATSRYTAFALLAGYRFGGPGTTLTTISTGRDYLVHVGSAVRFYPMGRAPLQLFISPGVEARVGRETTSVSNYNVLVDTSAFLASGWAFHFFERWALTVQGGLVATSFAFFHSDAGKTSIGGGPFRLYVSIATGVAF